MKDLLVLWGRFAVVLHDVEPWSFALACRAGWRPKPVERGLGASLLAKASYDPDGVWVSRVDALKAWFGGSSV